MSKWVCEVCTRECREKLVQNFGGKDKKERTMSVWICAVSGREKAVPGAWGVERIPMQLESLVCPSHLPLGERCPRDPDRDGRKHLTLPGHPPPHL